MNLSMKLQVRQSQSLVMTPQLLQSIRLLQFGALELQGFIEREIEQNPLLEMIPSAERGASALPQAPAAPREGDDDAGGPRRGHGPEFHVGAPPTMEDIADDRPGLLGHVMAELCDILPPGDRAIGETLAMHLDEAGYMRTPAEDIAASLGCPPAQVVDCLDRIRRAIEPAGLFAASLAECLSIQLSRQGRMDPVMAGILSHLDLLAKRDFAALRRLTGEDEDGLMEALSEIRRLNPKPGQQFGDRTIHSIVPDVFVSSDGGSGWRIRLNGRALPRLIVHNDYSDIVSRAASTGEKEYLAQCQNSAGWLIRSLDQRARTILKVTAEIVRRQEEFLKRGVQGLRPMTLASVAEAVSLHESTVSRVTANKFMATPRGTFELKFFFTVAIAATDGGDAHSAESVKLRIQRLIAAETVGNVLSDDDIALKLKDDGIDLARRTVAKYREALGLSSSIQRRRELNARRCAS
ncbi:RNA polymerase, sigma 54 subunit, RpoN/SigL [Aureimonas altamirensis DSM 21988]|uniref:RNA polymerase sigma-54 factor n=2 Tax=Aureimonas altamirensis TaxID=370622 RepID=A0ABY1IFA3_9HYPH|nr:RNA polymerase factor sigma-54 [Aureimonas altamirensis]SHJ08695.1 RNA polymerase, sigma 54 subunit, RpoN/SigL [Aureimonas altamirensis DSM 21988]